VLFIAGCFCWGFHFTRHRMFLIYFLVCCSSLNAQNRLVHLCSIWFIRSLLKWYCNFIVVGQSIEWSWLWLFEWRWMKFFFFNVKLFEKKWITLLDGFCWEKLMWVCLFVCILWKKLSQFERTFYTHCPSCNSIYKHSSLGKPCDYDINTSNFSSFFII
jgi:hypothetical protein